MTRRVVFTAVGREGRTPAPLEVPDDLPGSRVAERIHRHVRPFLMSRAFTVAVRKGSDGGSINAAPGGTFGTFTIEEVEQ